VELCSTPEWGRLKIFGLDWLHENTVFSGLGFVPEMSRLIVLQTVGVVDLLVMHPSKNAAEVILLCPTFVVTRVYVKLETSEAGTSEWVPSTEGESTTKTRKSTTMTRISCEVDHVTQVHIYSFGDRNLSGDVAFHISLYIIQCLSKLETPMVGSHKRL
jgi:hypothetical protein